MFTMSRSMNPLAIVILELLVATINFTFCNGSSGVICMESERLALLSLKQDLKDPSNRLRSWGADGADCCTWDGIVCDNSTGHVLELHLHHDESSNDEEALGGAISPALLDLKRLSYLDLGRNDFSGIQIPEFLGSMESLTFLNLSEAGFGKMIPPQLGNLSALRYLNLRNSFWGEEPLRADSLQWLSTLSSLEFLDLSEVNIHNANDWAQAVSMLHSLVELHVSSCDLNQVPYSLTSSANFSALKALDLSQNSFNLLVPSWVFEPSSLAYLNLRNCFFHGPIPGGLQNMTALRYLDISGNSFNSSIPDGLYSFSHLEYLDLGYNNLSGTLSSAIGNLTSLSTLDLSSNRIEGSIPMSLGQLCNLTTLVLSGMKVKRAVSEVLAELSAGCILDGLVKLDLSYTQLSGPVADALDRFGGRMKNLGHLSLRANSISGSIPESLGKISSLRVLDVSHNLLSGTLPESLGRLERLEELRFSNNSFHGVVSEVHLGNLTRLSALTASGNQLTLKVGPDWVPPFQLETLTLNSWRLGPQFPLWLCSQQRLQIIDISHTGISDNLPTCISNFSSPYLNLSRNQIHGLLPRLPLSLYILDVSENLFSGSISSFLCHHNITWKPVPLAFLYLQENRFTGKIPECWAWWNFLEAIHLENNCLAGNIPISLGSLGRLQSLHLRNNSLSGEIPSSLLNCTNLVALDLGRNQLAGRIPGWVGRFSYLLFLSLHSNKFQGTIPDELCHLSSLQILDFAHNNLSGPIPRCFNNFSAMNIIQHQVEPLRYHTMLGGVELSENAPLVTKGREVEYSTILNLVASMDLSDNNLFGQIPGELTTLHALESLNLSGNRLTGRIPEKIGDMRSLESLDFSRNQLSGKIPASVSSLAFLSHLNLSFNDLTGKIPLSTQIQSLSASNFIGNELCGPPLTDNCSNVSDTHIPVLEDEGNDGGGILDFPWFYVSVALGFVVGFWAVMGPILFSRSWRFAYFRLLDNFAHKVLWRAPWA